jgi:xanthine dehydrogenase accessory factor
MPEVEAWRALARALEAGGACAVLAVTDSRGSSPGRRGAVMAVGTAGPLAGTIGGGVAESALVDQVAADLRAGSLAPLRVRLAHQEGATDASGMICGGSQVVVVAPLHDGDRDGVASMVDALTAGRSVTWSIDPNGWQIIAEGAPNGHPTAVAPAWSAQLRSGPTHVVHVIGAGHVGSALVPLLVALDFRVVVVEERPGLASLAADAQAHERVVRSYEELAGVVCPGSASFAAIMTHSHERDAVALAALETLELGYLGLLGSRAKVRRIVGDRVMPAWFHAPLGVAIGSATPAEIAVSIAAEMVSVRSAARQDTTG